MSRIFDMLSDMSFREKSAWITFVSLLVAFTPFFYFSYQALTGQLGHGRARTLAFLLIAAFVALEVVLHAVAAALAPAEARTPRDERERLIAMRAAHLAYTVLLVGGLASAGLIHLSTNVWVMQQALLFVIVAAELVKFGTQIVLFRRGV